MLSEIIMFMLRNRMSLTHAKLRIYTSISIWLRYGCCVHVKNNTEHTLSSDGWYSQTAGRPDSVRRDNDLLINWHPQSSNTVSVQWDGRLCVWVCARARVRVWVRTRACSDKRAVHWQMLVVYISRKVIAWTYKLCIQGTYTLNFKLIFYSTMWK
jgi:hypothetical protein